MKKFILFLVVAGVLAVQGYKILDRKADERNSRERISKMFERLQSGSLADEQEAIGYWRVGHPESASEETANAFARFRARKGLRKIETYAITSSHVVDGSGAARSIEFVCLVNGRELRIRARHGFPLEWID